MNTQAVFSSISPARLSTYEAACQPGQHQRDHALTLYAWNAKVSAAMLAPLHICEVVTRNAVSQAIEAVYGARWPWSAGFEQSLPSPRAGYSPSQDLFNARRGQHTTGKVIPELKFVFWQKLFTRRFDQRIWRSNLRKVFPNLSAQLTDSQSRGWIYAELEEIRFLRNRIAHHEPIFSRDLAKDMRNIEVLIGLRCAETAAWMKANQDALALIQQKPQF